MRRLKLALTIASLSLCVAQLSAQTYYNPKDEINIVVQIKEPYKPINWAEIGQNFSNTLQQEAARREALKRYYDQIYYETKAEVQTGIYLTNDNNINQKIYLLNTSTLDHLDALNRLLKTGMLKPNLYESELRNTYFNYFSSNQVLLNISRYKHLRSNENTSDSTIKTFNETFNQVINTIEGFSVNSYSTSFNLREASFKSTNISSLYEYVTTSCEGSFELYQNNWRLAQQKVVEENAKKQQFLNEWIEHRKIAFELRSKLINSLGPDQAYKYREIEKKAIIDILKKMKQQDYTFSKLNPRKVANAWLLTENENHELTRLLPSANGFEPMENAVARSIVGVIYSLQKSLHNSAE